MDLDEAIAHTLKAIKTGGARKFGYDLAPRSIAESLAFEAHRDHDARQLQMADPAWSSMFFEAAWQLCRRGILRPGVRSAGGQATDDGGYSLTTVGQSYIESLDETSILLVQPGSLGKALSTYQPRFGSGFLQRSQEAIRCRNAEAWLACCAMVGAAAESILLALAVAKSGNEAMVLAEYTKSGGRQKVINMIVGQSVSHVQLTLKNFAGIISAWRDEASHGQASVLGTANADESLRQLLHMCQWVSKEWDALTLP